VQHTPRRHIAGQPAAYSTRRGSGR